MNARQIVETFMRLVEMRDEAACDLIVEHWACRDDLGLLVQLGARSGDRA